MTGVAVAGSPTLRRLRSQLVWLALGVVYVVWGSTYLGIRVVVQQAPPLTSMGLRYVSASVVLAVILTARGGWRRLRVTRRELAGAALLGLCLPVLGNGLVSVGENLGAPSGVTALLIATAPLMITVFRLLSGERPHRLSLFGILLGFGGLAFLVLARHGRSTGEIPLLAAGIIVFASTCWAFGSWVQPRLRLPRDPFVTTVYEMLCGGLLLVTLGGASGERFHPTAYDARTWLALGYLVVFGSVVAFTSYVWLLSSAPIALVATYAYVNPVVAVFLGWLVLSEPVTGTVLVGGGIVVLAVAIVISAERPRRKPRSPVAAQPDPAAEVPATGC